MMCGSRAGPPRKYLEMNGAQRRMEPTTRCGWGRMESTALHRWEAWEPTHPHQPTYGTDATKAAQLEQRSRVARAQTAPSITRSASARRTGRLAKIQQNRVQQEEGMLANFPRARFWLQRRLQISNAEHATTKIRRRSWSYVVGVGSPGSPYPSRSPIGAITPLISEAATSPRVVATTSGHGGLHNPPSS